MLLELPHVTSFLSTGTRMKFVKLGRFAMSCARAYSVQYCEPIGVLGAGSYNTIAAVVAKVNQLFPTETPRPVLSNIVLKLCKLE